MKTEIISILDRSGSMDSICKEVIGGYNSFLKDQREIPGEARVTLVQFDDNYEISYQGVDIKEVADLTRETFIPCGYTALLDAIGTTLDSQRKRIADEGWADQVIVCIVTDGAENASKKFKQAEIKEKITAAQDWGKWTFIFQAANQDAFASAKSFGIDTKFASNFEASAQGATTSYQSLTKTVRSMRDTSWNVQSPAISLGIMKDTK